jgi:hypothetical protein
VSEPPPKATRPTLKSVRKSHTAAVLAKPEKGKGKGKKSAGAIAISASRSLGKTPITPEFVESSGTLESDHPAEEQTETEQLSLDDWIQAQLIEDERMEQDILFD